MKLRLAPGVYVVAVSGGVDSMVLLDVARQLPGVQLIVAHFDHGIRPDSAADRQFVEAAAQRHGLIYKTGAGHLGAQASEATARAARYAFLASVQKEQGAVAIVTAHHQDDVLETAIINVVRGTGRKGLSSLASNDQLIRPLLAYSKEDIRTYAQQHGIVWREDSTNIDERYLRNYIRRRIVPRLSESGRAALLAHITRARKLNTVIDGLLSEVLAAQPAADQIKRSWFITLPHAVSREVMASWLRQHTVQDFDRRLIERLVVAAKTAHPGKRIDINAAFVLKISKDALHITSRNRS